MDYLDFIARVTSHKHLSLTFVADKPPPPQVAFQELLIAEEAGSEYFS